jgi:hypothetical protein
LVGVSGLAVPWVFVKYQSYFFWLAGALLSGSLILVFLSSRRRRAAQGTSCCQTCTGDDASPGIVRARRWPLGIGVVAVSAIAATPLVIELSKLGGFGCLGSNDPKTWVIFEIKGQNFIRDALPLQESLETFAGVETVKSFYGQAGAKLFLKIDREAQRDALATMLSQRGYSVAWRQPASDEERSAFMPGQCDHDQ